MNHLMGLESLPRDVVSYFVLGNTRRATLKNVALYSLISKTFYKTINSKEFFTTLAYWTGASEFLSDEILNLGCFKDRYLALRNFHLMNAEEFPGAIYGDTWVTEEGVTLFSFDPKLGFLQLKKGSEFNSIAFPENMPLDLGNALKAIPCIAKSKDYLAVHGSDLRVHIYSAEGKEYLTTYTDFYKIKQMSILDNQLYILEKPDCDDSCYLEVHDLEISKKLKRIRLDYCDPFLRLSIGKEYVVYPGHRGGASVVPLSDKGLAIHDRNSRGKSYYFLMGSGIVEINFQNDFQCDIWKLSIIGKRESTIKEDLVLPVKGELKDICLHEDRLLMAYSEPSGETTMVSYDFLLDQVTELSKIPSMQVAEETFKPRILCMAEKVYYLFMYLDDKNEYISNLTTFTFSKI